MYIIVVFVYIFSVLTLHDFIIDVWEVISIVRTIVTACLHLS